MVFKVEKSAFADQYAGADLIEFLEIDDAVVDSIKKRAELLDGIDWGKEGAPSAVIDMAMPEMQYLDKKRKKLFATPDEKLWISNNREVHYFPQIKSVMFVDRAAYVEAEVFVTLMDGKKTLEVKEEEK